MDRSRLITDRSEKKKVFTFVYAGLSLIFLCILLKFAGQTSFWHDELCQIAFIQDDLPTLINYSVSLVDGIPPLYGIAAYYWYRLIPFGDTWLLLLSIIPTALSAFFMAMIGKKTVNFRTGLLMETFFIGSVYFWGHIAFEFRGYSFLLFFSVLSFYLYILRNERESRYVLGMLNLSMTALCFSHYFGIMICGILFLADVLLLRLKKLRASVLLSYGLPGLTMGAWLVFVLTKAFRIGSSAFMSWQPVPSLLDACRAFLTVSGNQPWVLVLFITASWASFSSIFRRNERQFDWKRFYVLLSVCMVFSNIGVIYIYGAFINTTNTMWSLRYFFGLVPFMLFPAACVLNDVLPPEAEGKRAGVIAVLAGFFIAFLYSAFTAQADELYGVAEPYREAASVLASQNDLYDEKTLVVTTEWQPCVDGWLLYDCEPIMKEPEKMNIRLTALDFAGKSPEEIKRELSNIHTVYFFSIHTRDLWFKEFLGEFFPEKEELLSPCLTVFRKAVNES